VRLLKMTKGRKPEPTKLKILKGNPGHRKLPENEPMPDFDIEIKPPEFLDEYALEEWNYIFEGLHAMGVICSVDRSALAAYCCSHSIWRKAIEELNKLGLTEQTTNGNLIQSPYVGIANKASSDMLRVAAEFGFTPSARARLGMDFSKKKKSMFEGLLGKDLQ
jgi:P27 family predicted phage terminase small subunit